MRSFIIPPSDELENHPMNILRSDLSNEIKIKKVLDYLETKQGKKYVEKIESQIKDMNDEQKIIFFIEGFREEKIPMTYEEQEEFDYMQRRILEWERIKQNLSTLSTNQAKKDFLLRLKIEIIERMNIGNFQCGGTVYSNDPVLKNIDIHVHTLECKALPEDDNELSNTNQPIQWCGEYRELYNLFVQLRQDKKIPLLQDAELARFIASNFLKKDKERFNASTVSVEIGKLNSGEISPKKEQTIDKLRQKN